MNVLAIWVQAVDLDDHRLRRSSSSRSVRAGRSGERFEGLSLLPAGVQVFDLFRNQWERLFAPIVASFDNRIGTTVAARRPGPALAQLFTRVGFIVMNLGGGAKPVVDFYNRRGTAEQCHLTA